MKYKHIVWDFNGTIIDDVEAGLKSVNPLLEQRGLPTVDSVEQYRALFDFPVKDYYARLGFDFASEPYEKIAREWFDNYIRLSPDIKTVDGARELIMFFDSLGLEQIILSASEGKILKDKLSKLGLLKYFSVILSLDNIYAHGKADIALEFFKDISADEKSTYLMIGDTTHDAHAAETAGIDAVLVSCGHMSEKKLRLACRPVFDSMRSLLDYMKSL